MDPKKVNYPVLSTELKRLERLYQFDILGMSAEAQFDDISKLTAQILNLPICQITLMDKDWQDFISNHGVEMDGNNRKDSFCKYTVVQNEILEIEDTTKDERFKNHPFVVNDPNIRYYVGAPLLDSEGIAIGTLCGYGVEPNKITQDQREILHNLAKTVMRLIRYRKINADQRKYVNIFSLNQDLLCIISRDGYFKLVSPAFTQFLGWSESELLQFPLKKFIHPSDLKKVTRALKKMESGEGKVNFHCRVLTKTKKVIGIDWSCFLDDETTTIVASGHDNTTLINTKIALEKAITAKDEFMSNMSHEIRTPLSSIIGFTDLLGKSKLNEVQKSQINTVSIASNHLINIVNNVLDLYKLEGGKLSLEKEPLDLNLTLNKVKNLYEHSAQVKDIKLNLNCDDSIAFQILGDETRLLQILSNLIGNAIKFTNKGQVLISSNLKHIQNEKVTILFSVKDSGIGIEKNQKERIFERFTQAKEDTSRLYGGTGLGLNITKMLLDLHGSKISIDSELGVGSNFYFEVEFDRAKEVNRSNKQLESKLEIDLKGLTILLVEDNPHLELLTKTYLKKHNALVVSSFNGIQAIEELSKKEFDVILMDIQMPLMDGYTATNKIRNTLKLSTPIIGCSANSNPTEQDKCLEIGMTDYISKPYTEEGLITCILKNITKKNMERDDFNNILNELRLTLGDELIDEFQKIFTSRTPEDLADLESSLSNHNLEKIYRKAHFLSTTFCTLRFIKGEEITKKIDSAYKNGDENLVYSLTETLISYLKAALDEIQIIK